MLTICTVRVLPFPSEQTYAVAKERATCRTLR